MNRMLSIEGINISLEEPLDQCLEKVPKALDKFLKSNSATPSSIKNVGTLLFNYLKVIRESSAEKDLEENILKWHDDAKSRLINLCYSGDEEQIKSSFRTLLYLLPAQVVLDTKGIKFPTQQYADIIKVIISSHHTSSLITCLKELYIYEDMTANIWKALSLALSEWSGSLSAKEAVNVIQIINSMEKPNSNNNSMGPPPYYCQIKEGVIGDKEIEVSIKTVWNKLANIQDLSLKQTQMLLLALYEQLMPRMTKPIFLTDYFMTSLNKGGPVGLLALQGMFTLIQKYNMNYPDVYNKIYSMLDTYIFDAQYKSRFYYLTDLFLSSSHLPEALIAGFMKKFARLSLQAPPTDIIIMMTFILNLLIRHPGLKVLMHKASKMTNDPYDIDEIDPALSKAINSSLWEVKLIQHHCLPSVGSAAKFIDNQLPSVEKDLSALLDLKDEEMFNKEMKKKMKEPPVSFERPAALAISAPNNGVNLWSFS